MNGLLVEGGNWGLLGRVELGDANAAGAIGFVNLLDGVAGRGPNGLLKGFGMLLFAERLLKLSVFE